MNFLIQCSDTSSPTQNGVHHHLRHHPYHVSLEHIDKINLRAEDLDKADLNHLKPDIINFFKMCITRPPLNDSVFDKLSFQREKIKVLSHNYMSKVDAEYKEAKTLNYFGQSIQNVLFTEELNKVTKLVLSFNQLTSLKPIEFCPNLEELDVSYNHLTHVQGLRGLKSLQKLKLHHNSIFSAKDIHELKEN